MKKIWFILLLTLIYIYNYKDPRTRTRKRLGFRIALNGNLVTTGNGSDVKEEDPGMGLGGGGGLVAIVPINDKFATRCGFEFSYRTLYNIKQPEGNEESASEFAFSIPAMVQYTFFDNTWLGVGVQLDIPFASEIHKNGKSSEFKDRSAVDFGIIIGGSYDLIRSLNIALDVRGTIVGLALTNFSSKDNGSSLYQATLGFTYLF